MIVLEITSSVFQDGDKIPEKYTCDGKDISPPLKISNVPSEAETLAIVVDDPDAPGGVFDHWVIWNIPIEKNEIPEAVPTERTVDSLNGAKQGQNGFGEIGYRGPCPPGGSDHDYRFKAYAIEDDVDLDSGVLKEDLEREIEGRIIEKDSIVGVYGR